MGAFADMAQARYEGSQRSKRVPHSPKGFEPAGLTFSSSGLPETATVYSDVEPTQALDHRALIEERTNLTIPDNLEVLLERLTMQDGEGPARWWFKYKFVEKASISESFDAVALLKDLRSSRSARPRKQEGDSTFVLVFSDHQIGKLEGGGTPAFLERFDRSISQAEERLKELKKLGRGVGQLLLLWNGDLLEGCDIFPNHSWAIDSDFRTQSRVAATAYLDAIDRLAPLFSKVQVSVVPGNHGEVRLNGKKATNHDNRETELAEHLARTTERDSRLSHVEWRIADNQLSLTTQVSGHNITHTHGQAFGRGAATSVEAKALKWYSGQAMGGFLQTDLLVTSHFHSFQAADWGRTLWIQSPALDGGSEWFTETSGKWSRPSMLSFLVTNQEKFADMALL